MIILSEYGSAVFVAREKCRSKKRRSIKQMMPFRTITKPNGSVIVVKNENYVKETREERFEIEREEIKNIYKYLKEQYLDKDYAEQFMNEEETQKWLGEIPYHTEESLKCKYLNEDKHHCNLKRENTSCYTCCYECHTSKCCKDACILK
ncbi:hypothetical protein AM596_15240 [Clostridium perfringens CP4]|uniref:hypothetical protein n=1 Tax=Clostridium perfringens TaxID=1502 RepID=UPI000708122F|nr:hypothetical protein [Clostridium perfringens]KQC91380.1 hypothetical protein AM596_15240 [Clostridium perfringens CP4]